MNDLTFLDEELANDYGASNAILKAVLPGGKVVHISDAISPFKFLDTCPLLYHAFEYNAQSRLQAGIDTSSETAIISLVRYCYTGSYLAEEPDGENILLLQHAETYKIAEDFDVPELQIMAHGNFSCQIEYSCCLPHPPKDLLETTRFIYRHFASDEARRKHNLVDTLLNYCVAVYLYHKLDESLEFMTAVHEIPAFRQDLCRTNLARDFQDDWAADIIRLPHGPIVASSYVPTTLASRSLPEEMFYDVSRTSTNPSEPTPPTALSIRRKLPTPSRCVSPSALTAALERYNTTLDRARQDLEAETAGAADESLRVYKRARIDETTARLDVSHLEASGPPVKQECDLAVAAAEEEAFWAGAFGEESRVSNKSQKEQCMFVKREDSPVLQGCTEERLRPETAPSVPLLHRPRDPEPVQGASTSSIAAGAADSVSKDSDSDSAGGDSDDDFALIPRPRPRNTKTKTKPGLGAHSPMSSPELLSVKAEEVDEDEDADVPEDWALVCRPPLSPL